MRCIIVILALSVTCIHANESLDAIWKQWKRIYDKEYDGLDETERRSKWEQNLAKIQVHNLKYDLGLVTYSMGLNQFSDMDWDEFKKTYLPQTVTPDTINFDSMKVNNLVVPKNVQIPDSFDWRSVKNVVTRVKNQGQCGSCWAFSTTGAMEGQYNQHFSPPLEFSVQQLVDCSGAYGNLGCNGGLMLRAFLYIRHYGIEREMDYPYRAWEDKCQYNWKKVAATAVNASVIDQGDEQALQYAVAVWGPISVAVDVDDGFQQYRSGVYVSSTCSSDSLNHALLVVGYGTENKQNYWIVKNSWSEYWGEGGYIRMAKNRNNMCGIATMASFPGVARYP